MEKIDDLVDFDPDGMNDDDLFLRGVAGDDHQMLYLDSFLRDVFSGAVAEA